jgi:2-succinyl-5-enolpyruvyl-6-hydroxy-3-cyclohexene-1-carboxylate synthase
VYLEGISQLRGRRSLKDLEIVGGESLCKSGDFDGVIRIGSVPTLRFWRDLATGRVPVIHFSQRPWSGIPGPQIVHDIQDLPEAIAEFTPWSAEERERDRERFHHLERLLQKYPHGECAWVRRVSEWMPDGSRLFLGNSLPIREWDLAARRDGSFTIFANRGVNGIDGLISTFIGSAGETTPNWGLIGDLSALYDLTGPWALRERPLKDVNLVVINNGGGKIFERIFGHSLFENRHDLNFSDWARMWKWHYQRFELAMDKPKTKSPGLFEIIPDNEQTADFFKEWESTKC